MALATKVTPAICVLGSLLNMARRVKLVANSSVGEMMAGFQSASRDKYIRRIKKLYRNKGRKETFQQMGFVVKNKR